jgi:hypothetical protein
MQKAKAYVAAVVVIMVAATLAQAQETKFFQLALVPDVQIVKPADSVSGIRLSIFAENQDMAGLDLGIANITRGDFKGLGVDVISMVDGDSTGVSWNVFGYGRVGGDFTGWHSATFYSNLRGTGTGLQGSLISRTMEDFTGVQLGLAYAETAGHIGGVQGGIVNRASSVRGVQLGLVNLTDDMYGIQIGLVNYIKTGRLPVFVIANAKF